jgi:radical SAM protein with 4Fe4S-binding SPASM domain
VIEQGSYAEFGVGFAARVNSFRVPINVTVEISHRCPLECVHCYNNIPMGDHEARKRELTLEEHHRIIDELAEIGSLWLLYTGGEIFARPDFLQIYEHALKKGMLITLFTNGTMITERIADFLAAHPPNMMEITLYGRTKATYEALTGIPGSFEKCMNGIRLLKDRGIPLNLKTVAISVNKHEVPAMKRFAEEIGCGFKFDPMINPRTDCSASPLEVRLTPQEIVAMDLEDEERVSEWKRLATLGPEPEAAMESREVYDCGGGVNSFAIDPYGNMTICVLSAVDKYDVRKGSVRDGWDTFLRGVRARPTTRVTKCTTCPLTSLCGSCPANAELENGDPEEPVDFLCRTAHLRAEVMGIQTRPHGDCEYCPGAAHRGVIEEMAHDVRTRGPELASAIAIGNVLMAGASSCSSGSCGACVR